VQFSGGKRTKRIVHFGERTQSLSERWSSFISKETGKTRAWPGFHSLQGKVPRGTRTQREQGTRIMRGKQEERERRRGVRSSNVSRELPFVRRRGGKDREPAEWKKTVLES